MSKKIILKAFKRFSANLTLFTRNVPQPRLMCDSIIFPQNTYKIDPVSIVSFVDDICRDFHDKFEIKSISNPTKINVPDFYFVPETIRDIYSGRIESLLNDNSDYIDNKVVHFGFNGSKRPKPQRDRYLEESKKSLIFDSIETPKFNRFLKNDKSFVTIRDLKKRYKYLIDLKGHTYSTKSYLFLASKRVFFYSEPNLVLPWERDYLVPWENYIPIKEDLSDLKTNYNIIESDPYLYEKIVSNNIHLINNELSNESMKKKLIEEISTHLFYKTT